MVYVPRPTRFQKQPDHGEHAVEEIGGFPTAACRIIRVIADGVQLASFFFEPLAEKRFNCGLSSMLFTSPRLLQAAGQARYLQR
jgi:hypothetical protein